MSVITIYYVLFNIFYDMCDTNKLVKDLRSFMMKRIEAKA